jgi:signal transduction histidine kinase
MAENDPCWLAPGARPHVATLVRAIAPHAARLDAKLAALLKRGGYGEEQARSLLAITPAAASRRRTLDAFFRQVEENGRRLATLHVTPDQVKAVLQTSRALLEAVLKGRFGPAGEQMQLATDFAVYRAFYEVREREVRLLESAARQAEEQERRRIGRELHDEAGQSLLLLRLELEMLERAAPEELRPRLAAARGTTEMIVAELRRIVSALSPAVLERLGLAAALRHLTERFRNAYPATVRASLALPPEPLPLEMQEVIYRVVQESLNNVAKHSRASRVHVSVRAADKKCRARISDNGAGFSAVAAGRRPMSFGLAGMRERAELLGGTLTVRSAPGAGTVVVLDLPVLRSRDGQDNRTHATGAG